MNAQDLLELKAGLVRFDRFAAKHRRYVERMAVYFGRRLERVHHPLDPEDLLQIATVALWEAVRDYRFRCPACPRASSDLEVFRRHVSRRHSPELEPSPDVLKFVHGRVGRALDHECRRHTRREKFQADLPEGIEEDELRLLPHALATQESAAELAALIDAARAELGPAQQAVLFGMAYGLPLTQMGAAAGRIRREVREGFLRWRCA